MTARGVAERRAVVITGASTGIGEACALRLDTMGYHVFAGVRRDEDGAALQEKASARLTPLRLDVTDDAQVAAAAERVGAAVGETGLAGLVNNAGVAVAGPLEFLPVAELRRQLEVNVVAQLAVTQAFLPLLRQGSGRIVNMGSISGKLASPFMGPYSASKFAMEALSDALRLELRPWGIDVVLIEPGGIATPIWERSVDVADRLIAQLPPKALDYYGKVIPAIRGFALRTGKNGAPVSTVADAVADAFLAHRPQARYYVGPRASLSARVISRLPERVRDRLIAGQLPTYP